ncbi:protein phosphatase 1 regulatory subunit 42-like isoform X2 [Ambystoma mexicanum]|uniref:protein phosphatase 1 regulatory subunit 42-like isoform X2 n=1 Tax=Ambystoma mexicanum TaxID=8296 RepID=UPI0037E82E1C
MDRKIERQFVEDRATIIDDLPLTWSIKQAGPHYCVTMKMSRLKDLDFGFEFRSPNPRQKFPVTQFPERVLKLDVSLNELEELKAGGLLPFENLSELDASLNALDNIDGVGVLPNLAVLNLNYNALSSTKGLELCRGLAKLQLSHNQVRTIRDLPLLSNLTHLHLDSNKLKSLDGIQNLPCLHELYVQNNEISSLLHLSATVTLNILDASNNDLQFLLQSLQVLRGLHRLKQLKLKGNPLARDNRYVTAVAQSTSVEILDNALLKSPSKSLLLSVDQSLLLPDPALNFPDGAQMKEHLKESARKSFMEKLQKKRKDVEGTIHHLHNRILDLQEELKEYEENLGAEMEGCVRYIDTIPPEDFQSIDPQKVPRAMEKYLFTKFWERWELGRRRPQGLPFKDLTEPEEVLKAAAWLLSNPPVGASRDSD